MAELHHFHRADPIIDSLPTIADASRKLRGGEIQPLDLVEYCLAQIERWEDRIQAWVLVDKQGALAEAERQSNLINDGIDPGPLAGIPIGVKDIIDVAGWPTQAGSPLREHEIAERDAELVRRLRDAGAIILGKTVTTEFACFDPPKTRNPWNLERTPGGSSSGSAAAVALEMCMAAVGTQTGGSIIRPASYCGVVGLKPTFAKVSLDGVVPVSWHLDHAGPLARCVQDAAIVLEQMQAPELVVEQARSKPGLSVIQDFFFEQASPQMRSAIQTALDSLLDPLSQPCAIELPGSFPEVHRCHRLIMAVDAATVHRQQYSAFPQAFAPRLSSLLDEGLGASAVDYAAALQLQLCFQTETEQILRGQVAIMPATNTTAPGCETTGDPKFQSPWSFAGCPSITIPGGLDEDGLPWGLQLVGPRHGEPQLLAAAQLCQERLGFDARLPCLS